MTTASPDTGSRSPIKSGPEATPAVRRKLSTTAADLMAERDGLLPVWVRPPRGGSVEFYSGQSRATLYSWASQGFIRSVSIRPKGQVKGIRCFLLSSILDFIAKCEASANAEQAADKTEGGQ